MSVNSRMPVNSRIVIEPGCIRVGDDETIVVAKAIPASDLAKGAFVTNMGLVTMVARDGVYVVAALRGTRWSLASGTGDVAIEAVVWHESSLVSVDQL